MKKQNKRIDGELAKEDPKTFMTELAQIDDHGEMNVEILIEINVGRPVFPIFEPPIMGVIIPYFPKDLDQISNFSKIKKMGSQIISGLGGNRSITRPIKLKALEAFRNDLNEEWLKASKNIEELNHDWFLEVSANGADFEGNPIILLAEYNDDDYLYTPAA